MTKIRVALVGQPNVGKSALTNAIGKTNLKVGNFSGVTVSKKVVRFSRNDYDFEITDLPGSYSLNDYSIEERVTKNYIEEDDYDLILNVVDSSNIERNLYLTSELLAYNKKIVVALNMTDEATQSGIEIDAMQMGKLLGSTCIKTSAKHRTGIDELIQAIIDTYHQEKNQDHFHLSPTCQEESAKLITYLKEKNFQYKSDLKTLVIKLLKEDPIAYNEIHEQPIWIGLQPLLIEAHEHLYLHYDIKDVNEIFNQEIAAFSKGVVTETVTFSHKIAKSFTDQLDAILLNKIIGLPIFLFLMWGLFQITFEWGSIPMDWIDAFFSMLIDSTKSTLGNTELASVIADGAIAGVGAVVLFLPNIIILFFGIALLESTGYMSRVAFLLDGFFHKFGLHGKSFIPLVTGFGCSVPAYMAARTLKNDRDRLLTLFIIGFMSCGARLPIYVLFVGAFFTEQQAGNMLFVIYISGALIGIVAAKALKMTVFKGDDEPFVMEMPKYRLPTLKLIFHTVLGQASMYLKKAGTFILLASVLIWFASTYPKYPEIELQYQSEIQQISDTEIVSSLESELALYKLENSYLGKIGHASEPFFAPLGYDWRMAVALETGLAAKEIVVATLGVLYGLGEEHDESSSSLIKQIRSEISIPSAISFILFVMIYLPCLAASLVFMREAGGWKYLGYLFIFTTATAWGVSFIGYTLASALM